MKFVFSFILLFSTLSYGAAEAPLTPIEGRLQAFEVWHRDHARDQVVPDLQVWEKQDYQAHVHAVAGNAEATESLGALHQLWIDASPRMTYLNNALVYYGYSLILSKHLDPQQSVAEDLNRIHQVVGGVLEEERPLDDFNDFEDHITILQAGYRYGLSWLSFGSSDGLSTLRALNHACGLKAPLIGHPLKSSGFDGENSGLPSAFSEHDGRHGFFNFISMPPDVLGHTYDAYAQLDALVSVASLDVQSTFDIALYLLGHENGFRAFDVIDFNHPLFHRKEGLLHGPLTREFFVMMCDRQKLHAGSLHHLNQAPFAIEVTDVEEYISNIPPIASAYADRVRALSPKISFPSVVDFIRINLLPKDRRIMDHEMAHVCLCNYMLARFSEYNILQDICAMFKGTPFEFFIWEGDKINVCGISDAYTRAFDAFRDAFQSHFPEGGSIKVPEPVIAYVPPAALAQAPTVSSDGEDASDASSSDQKLSSEEEEIFEKLSEIFETLPETREDAEAKAKAILDEYAGRINDDVSKKFMSDFQSGLDERYPS